MRSEVPIVNSRDCRYLVDFIANGWAIFAGSVPYFFRPNVDSNSVFGGWRMTCGSEIDPRAEFLGQRMEHSSWIVHFDDAV